jgi:Transketolase, C-terminal domain
LPSVGDVKSRWLRSAGETQDGYYQPLEKAEMVRSGGDVTILCYSRMRYVVMQAVAQLEKDGYDPEVRAPLFLGVPVGRHKLLFKLPAAATIQPGAQWPSCWQKTHR